MRWLGLLPGWALLVAAVAVPQLVRVTTHSLALSVLAAFALLAAWAGLLVAVGRSLQRGLIGAAVGLVVVGLSHKIGADHFQQAILLTQGRALDGVTLAELLAKREHGLWVRLTDARVRSEAKHDFTFFSGGGENADGSPQATTSKSNSVAPITLASEVMQEEPMMRRKPTGQVLLWACAPNIFVLGDWDTQRQAVRGRLERMEDRLFRALSAELTPGSPPPIPGMNAIPAAQGSAELPVPSAQPEGLSLSAEAWCVQLDSALDANAAKEQAQSDSVVLVLSFSFFTVLAAFVVARSRSDGEGGNTLGA